jgi:hypothetical protein
VALNNDLTANGNNITKFATFFGGMNSYGSFSFLDVAGYWWGSDSLNNGAISFDNYMTSTIELQNGNPLSDEYSVRCLRGDPQ